MIPIQEQSMECPVFVRLARIGTLLVKNYSELLRNQPKTKKGNKITEKCSAKINKIKISSSIKLQKNITESY
jgi:hypothetical protein